MDWQPIETAPRDGRRLLLCNECGFVFVGGYDPHWTGQCWVSENPRLSRPISFTHWMPLPAPPSDIRPAKEGE